MAKKIKNSDDLSEVKKDPKNALDTDNDFVDGRESETEDDVLDEAALDSTDDDGDPLNEGSFGDDVSGDDLDIPGDEDEDDEENSDYSTDKNEDDSEINYDA
jgi:hypothetical protein